MAEQSNDAAPVRFPPPLVAVLATCGGWLLQRFAFELDWPRLGWLGGLGGVALIVVGAVFMAGALQLFRRSGQDPKPWRPTPSIVTSGVYRWTRNPMYLGMGLVQAGIGTITSNAWIVLLVPVTWAAIYQIAIRHEEAYLAAKFGTEYTAYKRTVRRWL